MSILREINISIQNVLETFFGSDTEVMSNKVKDILAHPEDRKKYLEAIEQLKIKEGNGEVGATETIKLNNNEEITLTT